MEHNTERAYFGSCSRCGVLSYDANVEQVECSKSSRSKQSSADTIERYTYPNLRGVDGGVQGELPSLYEPPREAPCLFRTAFNRLIVELLNPYLNDCKKTDSGVLSLLRKFV